MPVSLLEAVLRRDRLVTIALLTLICVAGWLYTIAGVGMSMTAIEMTHWPLASGGMSEGDMSMDGMSQDGTSEFSMSMGPPGWSLGYSLLMLGMWWFMMVAMMLPSAAPTILLAAAINRRSTSTTPPFGPTIAFIAGYLGSWLVFSVIAVIVHLTLANAALVSGMMASTSWTLSAILLMAAGLWQWTPLKQACLRHCRSPMDFLLSGRGQGFRGAFRTGLGHGAYCLGCCWFLMALLFVGGVMNLFWIVGLALVVLIEKVTRFGVLFGKAAGVVLLLAGVVMLVSESPALP